MYDYSDIHGTIHNWTLGPILRIRHHPIHLESHCIRGPGCWRSRERQTTAQSTDPDGTTGWRDEEPWSDNDTLAGSGRWRADGETRDGQQRGTAKTEQDLSGLNRRHILKLRGQSNSITTSCHVVRGDCSRGLSESPPKFFHLCHPSPENNG